VKYRFLGERPLRVSAVGYGCPSFVGRPSPDFEANAIRVLHRAIDLGVTELVPVV
jgi:aryl-alcohol dehydrogenase-like predicted oxidoreductase